jgi:hypothetical protein
MDTNTKGSKKIKERRKHPRFKVKEGVFAVLVPDSSKLGEVVDISKDGFSFRYSDSPFIDNDRGGLAFLYHDKKKSSYEMTELEIFLVDSDFYLKVPCKVISDFDVTEKNSSNSITINRSGVQFKGLSPDQISGLEDFIRDHTENY